MKCSITTCVHNHNPCNCPSKQPHCMLDESDRKIDTQYFPAAGYPPVFLCFSYIEVATDKTESKTTIPFIASVVWEGQIGGSGTMQHYRIIKAEGAQYHKLQKNFSVEKKHGGYRKIAKDTDDNYLWEDVPI